MQIFIQGSSGWTYTNLTCSAKSETMTTKMFSYWYGIADIRLYMNFLIETVDFKRNNIFFELYYFRFPSCSLIKLLIARNYLKTAFNCNSGGKYSCTNVRVFHILLCIDPNSSAPNLLKSLVNKIKSQSCRSFECNIMSSLTVSKKRA